MIVKYSVAVFDNWVEALIENCYRNMTLQCRGAGRIRGIVTDLQFIYNCEIALTITKKKWYNQCVRMSLRIEGDAETKEDPSEKRKK